MNTKSNDDNERVILDDSHTGLCMQCLCCKFSTFGIYSCKHYSDIPQDIWHDKKRCPHAEYDDEEIRQKVNLLFENR